LSDPSEPIDSKVHEIEGGPRLPSAALAAHATPGPGAREERRQTDRDIWALTWPVVLSMSMASAVGVIDIAMVGRLGADALAASGYAMQLFWVTQAVLMSTGPVCVALMSRAIGAGVSERARRACAACLVVAVATGLVMLLLGWWVVADLMRLLGATEAIVDLAVPYFDLTMVSALFFGVSFTYENAFRAARDARTPMLVSAAVTVVKVILNYVLIFGELGFPALGLVGAGLATIGSQLIASLLFVGISRRPGVHAALRVRLRDLRGMGALLPEMVRLSLPVIAERLVMNLALLGYFGILGQYGPATIAAYTVGVRVLSFSWIPGIGFSTAASTLVGQALGASEPQRAMRAGWRSARFATLVSLVLGVAFALARHPLARVFTDDPGVIEALLPFMLILALSQPFLGLHFTLGGALRGAGDMTTPFWAALIGNWAFRVPMAAVFAWVLEWNVVWVWFALSFDHVSRSVWMLWAFRRGDWARNVGVSASTEG